MEAEDELHGKLKKKHHRREIIVRQHSRGGRSNGNLVAIEFETNRRTKARRSTHSHRSTHLHLRNNGRARTPRLQR